MKTKIRKGIILAGGLGTRLKPLTAVISKQLLPIYNKPMIYFPLSNLINMGVNEILLISDPYNMNFYKKLLGNGKKFNINLKYKIQYKPDGVASAYLLAEKFLNKSPSVLILGDNIFYGSNLDKQFKKCYNSERSSILTYEVTNPSAYGVLFKKKNKFIIIEKPKKKLSNSAIVGIYFLDERAPNRVKKLKFSKRNELEIVDLLNKYRKKNKLNAQFLGRGGAWLDTGSIDDFYKTSSFVSALENRQGLKIACIEEIALNYNWINKQDIVEAIKFYGKCLYSSYLKKLID